MHTINSIYNKCFKYYIGNTKFVLYKKCVNFAYFIMHIISYNCHSTKDDLIRWQNEWKTVGVAITFLIVVRVTQGVWEFYWAKNLKKV
jgi:hypothetical protein